MSYLVLARKYRPQTFDQVVEQQHVTQTLANAIDSGRVAHAVLFSGPRGTGKTTVARLLAKAMNCEQGPTAKPCNHCRSCNAITLGNASDVFEIDGASNNSVDQIRDLRENIKYKPVYSPYRIYIIDEVHMLSLAAFNALLKTLEEPPAHVMFMFATTEPHKIPTTILSRCQRHDLRRISTDALMQHLKHVGTQEGAQIEAEALVLLAREAGGSVRDALSLFDQLLSAADGAITAERLVEILGVIDRKLVNDMTQSTLMQDLSHALAILDTVYARGLDLRKFYADLLAHFRNLLVIKLGAGKGRVVDLPRQEIDQIHQQLEPFDTTHLQQLFDVLYQEEVTVRLAPVPKLAIEMVLFRLHQLKPAVTIDRLIDKLDQMRTELLAAALPQPSPPATETPGSAKIKPVEQEVTAPPKAVPSGSLKPAAKNAGADLTVNWRKIREMIAEKHPSLAAHLANSIARSLNDNNLLVHLKGSTFDIARIRRKKNVQIVEKICSIFWGRPVTLALTTEVSSEDSHQHKRSRRKEIEQKALNHPLVADALEIFEGQLVDIKIKEEDS